MTLNFTLKSVTKTCYRFEHSTDDGRFITLYLKKDMVDGEKINPNDGIIVTVEGAKQ